MFIDLNGNAVKAAQYVLQHFWIDTWRDLYIDYIRSVPIQILQQQRLLPKYYISLE